MLTEAQEAQRNPALLNCGVRTMPVCRKEGGRASKKYSMCECKRL